MTQSPSSDSPSREALALLRLTLVPKLGPVRIARILSRFGSAERALSASSAELESVEGIGRGVATTAVTELARNADAAADEVRRLSALGARLVTKSDAMYPALLRPLDDAPPLLSFRGLLAAPPHDTRSVAIVGSRDCSAYGLDQAARFASALALAGYTIVSGGARGIDTATHRAVLQAGGSTIAVLGCGLGQCYPPENAGLFDAIAADGRGAVVSELPVDTPPNADNFPARNRIISGLALGVIVIEAGGRSGALITARQAVEDHGREAMALPGRVDAPGSVGCHALIRSGGAHLVASPADVMEILDPIAAMWAATRSASQPLRSGPPARDAEPHGLFAPSATPVTGRAEPESSPAPGSFVPGQSAMDAELLRLLRQPATADDLAALLNEPMSAVRGRLTMLEVSGRIRRDGSRFVVR